MNVPASRTYALKKLDFFIENNLLEYTKLRNFDFGIENRENISYLSPFVTHGIINEKEIINFSNSVDIITYEFENIPKETLELINDNKLRPGVKSLEQTQDRLIERKLLEKLNIPYAPYKELNDEEDFNYSISNFGDAIIKTRRFGYDGKGQISVNQKTNFDKNISSLCNQSIIEKKNTF